MAAMERDRLGRILAAGLIIGGSVLTGIGANTNAHRADTCTKTCPIAGTSPEYATFYENLARIAARAAEPALATKGEWLSLYLLLPLRAGGNGAAL